MGEGAVQAQMEALTLATKSGIEWAKYSHRVFIKSILGRPDGGAGLLGHNVRVGGWVKTGRSHEKGRLTFLELNDGSCPANLQVIVEDTVTPDAQLIYTGTCLVVEGELTQPPETAKKQKVELRAQKVLEVGPVDASKYPIAKGRHTLEFLRNLMHLRSRTNTISSVARIRNALAFATHTFFQQNRFVYVHTPIITTSDCEGAGEMFQVTTMFSEAEKREKELASTPAPTEADLEQAKAEVTKCGETVKALKAEKKSKDEIAAAVLKLQTAKDELAKVVERMKLTGGIPKKDKGGFDYTGDFFGRQAFLTVSGQLQVETYACSLSNVYTFGPTFRAENSHTTRHLAEFWMIEPELAFADLQDDMNCAEDYVKFLCQWLLDNCYDDMEFMTKMWDNTALDRLKLVASTPFARITYTQAIEKLLEVKDRTFENPVSWGVDLASEHERYLAEELFQKPVIVYNYPKDIKAFYMRMNDDGKTVAAMDILVPKVGELVGGSQREERYEVLVQRLQELNLPTEPYEWYLDLRRYGTVKHSGFGLGFERMVLFATGLENIRDVIPFPRYPGKAEF
ncbi:asparagine--tRNA ligase, cytoplasmic 1 [Selaginella moellendorffii]|uniref:asparagine--tRNA ligase, cytoplasmic 1 n=1 Tax=Selaginella moellendorffii TaxID=88036 RepID=UPI000D1CAC86|nr:asparagine--tRNA ligase, cytoplasmic 1 [Selaginella moellendorffii]|eukprot:XP_024514931.1 asparagine--tRNA ligase, cytoplasmic 1 [Selaginella moellendorffii]